VTHAPTITPSAATLLSRMHVVEEAVEFNSSLSEYEMYDASNESRLYDNSTRDKSTTSLDNQFSFSPTPMSQTLQQQMVHDDEAVDNNTFLSRYGHDIHHHDASLLSTSLSSSSSSSDSPTNVSTDNSASKGTKIPPLIVSVKNDDGVITPTSVQHASMNAIDETLHVLGPRTRESNIFDRKDNADRGHTQTLATMTTSPQETAKPLDKNKKQNIYPPNS
jgi:hypothetical protein